MLSIVKKQQPAVMKAPRPAEPGVDPREAYIVGPESGQVGNCDALTDGLDVLGWQLQAASKLTQFRCVLGINLCYTDRSDEVET
jgi:hypothetical protein